MNEAVSKCVCGSLNPPVPSWSYREGPGDAFQFHCLSCGRRSSSHPDVNVAIAAWNDEISAIKAAREPKPETQKNRVYAGEWRAKGCEIMTSYGDDEDEHICNITNPAPEDYSDAPEVAVNTARLMAASKGMYRLLKGFLDGEFNDGASSAVIEGAEKLIKKLDLDVD